MQPQVFPTHEEAFLYRQPGYVYVYPNSTQMVPAPYYPQQQYNSHQIPSPVQYNQQYGIEPAWTHNAPNQCWQQQQSPTWTYSRQMQSRSPGTQGPMTCLSILNQRTSEEIEADLNRNSNVENLVQLQHSHDRVRNRTMRRKSFNGKNVPRFTLV